MSGPNSHTKCYWSILSHSTNIYSAPPVCPGACAQKALAKVTYQHAWNYYSLFLKIYDFLEIVWRLRKTFDLHCKSICHGPKGPKLSTLLERLRVWSASGQDFLSSPSSMPTPDGSSSSSWPLLSGAYLDHKWPNFIFWMKNHIFVLFVAFHSSLIPCPNYLCNVTSVLVY